MGQAGGLGLRFALSLAVLPAQLAGASIYLIDFNTTDPGSHPGGSPAWNIYAAPTDVNGGLIHDTAGSTAAGITLTRSGTVTDSGNGGTAVFNNAAGGPSWVTTDGSLGDTGAAGDYFYTSTDAGAQTMTMTLGNLAPGSLVSLDLWTSRVNATCSGFYEYSLDGGSSWSGFTVLNRDGSIATGDNWNANDTQSQGFQGIRDGNAAARYMNVSNVTLSGSSLVFRTTDDTAVATWSGIGAVRLAVVPEPSTFGLGLLVLLGLRRIFSLRHDR